MPIPKSPSTISREFHRSITFVRTALGSWQYKVDYAQGYANERQRKKPKHNLNLRQGHKKYKCRYGSSKRPSPIKNKVSIPQRQYLPKGSDFFKLTVKALQCIEDKINSRPRKSLEYKTPIKHLMNL